MLTLKLQAHERPINALKINYDGDLLFSASADGKVNLWNALTGERLGSYQVKSAIKVIDVSLDSKYLVLGTLTAIYIGVIGLFEVMTGKHIGEIHTHAKCNSIQFSLGDKMLLVHYESLGQLGKRKLVIYDTQNLIKYLEEYNKQQNELQTEQQEIEKIYLDNLIENTQNIILKLIYFDQKTITQVIWGPLNKYFIVSTNKGSFCKIDFDGNILQEKNVTDKSITQFAVSKDWSLLLFVNQEGGQILDPETFDKLRVFKQDVQMNACALSPLIYLFNDKEKPKYHCIMAGGIPAREAAMSKAGGFEIHLINLMYEKEIGQIGGHFGPVNCLVYHQDGRGYASAGEEGIIRVIRFDKTYFEDKQFA